MTPSEFETRLRDLLREQAHVTGNAQCIECHGCEKCVLSTFCRDSKGLSRATTAPTAPIAADCSHCRIVRELPRLQPLHLQRKVHPERSPGSLRGALGLYVLLRQRGAHPQGFHILNEPYSRSEYFAITTKLSQGLRL